MSVLTATEAHHVGEVQSYTPHPDEWRKASGSINSVNWETATTTGTATVDDGCYDTLDDEAIIKHYLDPPCTAHPGQQHLPQQKKSRLRRIRNMLKPAPSAAAAAAAASTSPFPPPPPHYDHPLSKPTAAAEAEVEAEAAHKRETFIHTVEDMAIGASSLCSQSSTISSTVSDPSFSTTTTTFTTIDDTIPRSSTPPPHMRPSAMSSRLKFALSKLRGNHHHHRQSKQIVPEPAKLEFRDSLLTASSSDSLAGRIRSKLQRRKSAAMATTMTPADNKKIPRSHSMSSIIQYHNQKNTVSTNSSTADTKTPGPKGILRVPYSSSKPRHRTPHYFGRHRSSRPLSSLPPSSLSQPTDLHSRCSIPLIQASDTSVVRFASVVSVRETYSRYAYDRTSDPEAVCTRLTPTMAQYIKQELNMYKLYEMHVHQHSRTNTHFFF